MTDSELACDAGAIRQIGIENSLEYGKTLIEIAHIGMQKKNKMQFFECSTSAAGGAHAMKRRINLIVKRPKIKVMAAVFLIIISIGIVGCTFGKPLDKEEALYSTETDMEMITGGSAETEIQIESVLETKTEQEWIEKIETEDMMTYVYKKVTLYREADPDKVCIWIAPPGARQYLNYCYIPEGEIQEKLLSFMENLEEEWQEHNKRWKGMKETGYQISYKGRNYFVFEGSFLYAMDSDEEKGPIELFVKQEELCGFVQELLKKELDYIPYDITQIKDTVSAELEMKHWLFTDEETISQTITDKESLEKFENWFSNAEYIRFGADCGNASSCLTLTLADGEEVKLSVATDSCPNFGINGVYYDYRPNSKFDNREFFKCFDEIYENVLKEHYE